MCSLFLAPELDWSRLSVHEGLRRERRWGRFGWAEDKVEMGRLRKSLKLKGRGYVSGRKGAWGWHWWRERGVGLALVEGSPAESFKVEERK